MRKLLKLHISFVVSFCAIYDWFSAPSFKMIAKIQALQIAIERTFPKCVKQFDSSIIKWLGKISSCILDGPWLHYEWSWMNFNSINPVVLAQFSNFKHAHKDEQVFEIGKKDLQRRTENS